jgi:phosphate transport system substrate-binding protein
VKNRSGNWIVPSLASTSASGAVTVPSDITKLVLTDSEAADGYPISAFTWILVYKEQDYGNRPKGRVETMMKLLWWMVHDAQQYAEPLAYARLPHAVVTKAEAILRSVTYDGVPVLVAP